MTPIAMYNARLDAGELLPDPEQEKAIIALDRLYQDITTQAWKDKPWWRAVTDKFRKSDDHPRGVYMYGGVGRGKSMLMDLFYECLPEDTKKERIHFHQFMINAHDYFHTRRKGGDISGGIDGLIPSLASIIAAKSKVLCFDEFHVTDVADAMILGRLFTALFDRGVIVVATSNWAPPRLYEGGLQRERFLPFIALLENRMDIVHLDSPTDYRAQAIQEEGSYFSPLGPLAQRSADDLFAQLTDQAYAGREYIEVKGRTIKVQVAVNGVARFTFAQLCESPHGAEDYLAIAQRYPVVFLEKIPKLTYDRRNEAKRLMTLIDALYESKTKLIITAAAAPHDLYRGHDHAFEFDRTISRLMEMQSEAYLAE